MNREGMNPEDTLRQAVRQELGQGPLPTQAQAKLEEAYSLLESTPQEQPQRPSVAKTNTALNQPVKVKRVVKKGFVIAVAAALVALFGGTAFAVSRMIEMQAGDAPFFQSGNNLPVYDSLQAGVSSLNAPVGDTIEVEGVRVTLDMVSCDRNIVNLFFTLEKEGGFDLSEQSNYEGSQENEWTRLQRFVPRLDYSISSNGDVVDSGLANQLDAYVEDGKVKCLQRIVPQATLPTQVEVNLKSVYLSWLPRSEDASYEPHRAVTFDVGLDLSSVTPPKELGAQDLVFPTSEGDKAMGITRFTTSELGTVMVVRNDTVETIEEGGRPVYSLPETAILPQTLKIADNNGNVLTPVDAGDGSGINPAGDYVVELAGLSSDATGVSFTPMLSAIELDTVEQRLAFREQYAEQNERHIDVSQIGTKLPTSEFGGYEMTGWEVSNNTVSISLKPYGWLSGGGHMELIPEQEVTYLASEYTSSDGQTGTGYHSGILYRKTDYQTGELVQITSYYAATDEELRGLTQYGYGASFGLFREEVDATQTLSFIS